MNTETVRRHQVKKLGEKELTLMQQISAIEDSKEFQSPHGLSRLEQRLSETRADIRLLGDAA